MILVMVREQQGPMVVDVGAAAASASHKVLLVGFVALGIHLISHLQHYCVRLTLLLEMHVRRPQLHHHCRQVSAIDAVDYDSSNKRVSSNLFSFWTSSWRKTREMIHHWMDLSVKTTPKKVVFLSS